MLAALAEIVRRFLLYSRSTVIDISYKIFVKEVLPHLPPSGIEDRNLYWRNQVSTQAPWLLSPRDWFPVENERIRCARSVDYVLAEREIRTLVTQLQEQCVIEHELVDPVSTSPMALAGISRGHVHRLGRLTTAIITWSHVHKTLLAGNQNITVFDVDEISATLFNSSVVTAVVIHAAHTMGSLQHAHWMRVIKGTPSISRIVLVGWKKYPSLQPGVCLAFHFSWVLDHAALNLIDVSELLPMCRTAMDHMRWPRIVAMSSRQALDYIKNESFMPANIILRGLEANSTQKYMIREALNGDTRIITNDRFIQLPLLEKFLIDARAKRKTSSSFSTVLMITTTTLGTLSLVEMTHVLVNMAHYGTMLRVHIIITTSDIPVEQEPFDIINNRLCELARDDVGRMAFLTIPTTEF